MTSMQVVEIGRDVLITAMILAIAFGIAVDDTIHIMYRLKTEIARCDDPRSAVAKAMAGTGRAIVFTTVVLIAGFVSMLANDLIAIQDMGLVAAVTIFAALVADLILAPASFVWLTRIHEGRIAARLARQRDAQ